jgi:hypothetical protein
VDFDENVDGIGDGGFDDDTIIHKKGFLGIELGVNLAKEEISVTLGDMMM